MIENWAITVIEYLVQQAPAVAILSVIAWRLEQRVNECIDHHEKTIDRLLDAKVKQD